MLIWINGPFGVGKTATAYELNRRLPGSAVCDPAHVGFGMRRMLPPSLRGNFQDILAWRVVAIFIAVFLIGRSHGQRVMLTSAAIAAIAAPMIFEFPFDLIVMARTNPAIPPDPALYRVLFFAPLFLAEATTLSLLTFSPMVKHVSDPPAPVIAIP
jgi:hypothetical protein